MGLRLKIIGILVAVLTLLAATSSYVLQSSLQREAVRKERSDAVKDMQRLLLSLDNQLNELGVVLSSWANFTSFYHHAVTHDPAFRESELNAQSLKAAHFDLLMLVNDEMAVVEFVEAPLADGSEPLRKILTHGNADRFSRMLQRVVTQDKGCGLMNTTAGNHLFVCFHPLLTSHGSGPAHGTVVIGRWLSDKVVARVSNETGLKFAMKIGPPQSLNAETLPEFSTLIGQGAVTVVEHDDYLDVAFPLFSLIGEPIGEVVMHWPRESRPRMQEMQQLARYSVIILIAFTGVILVGLIDLLVVRRLRRFKDEINRVLDTKEWSQAITANGQDEIADLAQAANTMIGVVSDTVHALHEQSVTDPMTGLANRRRFDASMELMVRQFHRDKVTGALVLFDVDHFKRYNDHYGHPAGDAALTQVAECLRAGSGRPTDLPARLGGEEFALLLALSDREGAHACASKVQEALRGKAIPHTGNPATGVMTLSIGIALLRDGDTAESLYSRADAALYAAKNSGRNRVADDGDSSHE